MKMFRDSWPGIPWVLKLVALVVCLRDSEGPIDPREAVYLYTWMRMAAWIAHGQRGAD